MSVGGRRARGLGLRDYLFIVVIERQAAIEAPGDVPRISTLGADGISGDFHVGFAFRTNDVKHGSLLGVETCRGEHRPPDCGRG
jgi:hypothetical protein